MILDLSALVNVAGVLVAVAAGAIWLRSTLVRQRHEELADLAKTRGDRIEDLEKEQQDMKNEVAELRGQVKVLRSLKSDEIADAVVRKLDELGRV